MELILNEYSIDGQFEELKEFQEYFNCQLRHILQTIEELGIFLYKIQELYMRPLIGEQSLHSIMGIKQNNVAITTLKRMMQRMMREPYWNIELVKTHFDTEYEYPLEAEEPNCFTEAIERECPLLSFPLKQFEADYFECSKNTQKIKIPNIKTDKALLEQYLLDSPDAVRYVWEHYPFSKKVNLAVINGRCYAEEALTSNELTVDDLIKLTRHIEDLVSARNNGKKTRFWDSIEKDIDEYRMTISGSREFRLLFTWRETIVFLNGFIKKVPKTPEQEKKRAREIIRMLPVHSER